MFVVTAKEMYAIDHYTKEKIGFKNLLMENAGRAVCQKLYSKLKRTDRIVVFAGTGNNGGDGFVIARTLMNQKYDVSVVQTGPNETMTEETLFHKQLYLNCGGKVIPVERDEAIEEILTTHHIVVDAMMGIGVKGKLREPLASLVLKLNTLTQTIISVDIPSGLPADEGEDSFLAIEADYTVVIGAPKMSAYLEYTATYYGAWDVVSIGYPPKAFEKYTHRYVTTVDYFQTNIPERRLDSHKGSHGKGLVIGGSDNMPGSLAMTIRASLRAGAGLIQAATTDKVIDCIAALSPEATYLRLSDTHGFISGEYPYSLLNYDAIAVGIGMGREEESFHLLSQVIEQDLCPLVIDADGLFHLQYKMEAVCNRNQPVIITPHPGEMARLLGTSIVDVKRTPFRYSLQIAKTYNVYVVLKGRFTIITTPTGKQAVNVTGNPGLAKGGSGDVLTGIILAMVMQELNIFTALRQACFLHGMAADLQVKASHSHVDLIATDVIDGISKVYHTFLH